MSDREALIRGILESPDDDAPRLVFADWLEETGEPANVARAEFIRVQCAIAREPDDAARRSLYLRETQLEMAWLPQWQGLLRDFAGVEYGLTRRGFVDFVWFDGWHAWDTNLDALQSELPIHRVRIKRVGPKQLHRLLEDPRLARITHLDLSSTLLDTGSAVAISCSEQVGRLRELILNSNQFCLEGVVALLTSTRLAAMQWLVVWGNRLSSGDWDYLLDRYGNRLPFYTVLPPSPRGPIN
jgi:uncharacterized protein (TIGR02996 family)